ncbi:hypothetical protein MCUN1_000350 [Malassezia cuniculi]|uniref:Tethering factor for nuclear proteasome STS1 n=1 Tax=Malassezia cuniculi TaxID=948313 RepID=A0AAF0J4L3_9BASI|nr:hypothetical protein MCUN1_000350 [Malassezia cuniculi]
MPSTPLLPPQLPAHPPSLRHAGVSFGVGLPPAPPSVPFNANAPQVPAPVAFGFGCGAAGSSMTGPTQPIRPEWRPSKRTRDDDDEGDSIQADEDMDDPKRRRASRRAPSNIDLGSALAALDRPALLTLLHDLISSDEAIAARVYTNLPTPSLESISAQLDAAEENLRGLLPSGSVREQYVWGRVRAPLAELASMLAGLLPLFAASSSRREPVHPATAFAFLHMVTTRVLQLERMLPPGDMPVRSSGSFAQLVPQRAAGDSPDALASMVFPELMRKWELWLTTVDAAVNREGRMYGHDVVVSWMRGLHALGPQNDAVPPVEGAMRLCLGSLLDKLQGSLGWLIGMRFAM